ncbi:hypothetical protein QBC39DRAFT_112008 [Podospora conica]|nr:hypothetical protein QBC39DRAFT_112008 [Schizothecium conicum]
MAVRRGGYAAVACRLDVAGEAGSQRSDDDVVAGRSRLWSVVFKCCERITWRRPEAKLPLGGGVVVWPAPRSTAWDRGAATLPLQASPWKPPGCLVGRDAVSAESRSKQWPRGSGRQSRADALRQAPLDTTNGREEKGKKGKEKTDHQSAGQGAIKTSQVFRHCPTFRGRLVDSSAVPSSIMIPRPTLLRITPCTPAAALPVITVAL